MPGLYFHIPFCKQACHYCDFHFSTNLIRQSDMVEAMTQELVMQNGYLQNIELSSIYFGGGTPSLLGINHFEKIFNSINKNYSISRSCEITLEANPDDLSLVKLKELLELGINRLSIGVQSFDSKILSFLNRAHDGQMAINALEHARAAGFNNISIDLIYAIPGQDKQALVKNIDTALQFSPEHISAYGLTIESKTVFGNWVAKNRLIPVDETSNAEEFEILGERLANNNYEHYEISNYCKPGYYSQHNSSYWKQESYLGIGPSAHSYNMESRQFNISNNASYLKSIGQGEVPFKIEILTPENKINEYVFTALRTMWGCDLEKLKAVYSFDLLTENENYIEALKKKKLVTIDNHILRLTHQGKLLADQISMALMHSP